MLARQRLPFPRVHEQHVIVHGAHQRQVGRICEACSGHDVGSGAQHELCFRRRYGELRDRSEANAAPPVVKAAPGRHAVEIADIVNLRQRHEIVPGQGQRMIDQAADLERPLGA